MAWPWNPYIRDSSATILEKPTILIPWNYGLKSCNHSRNLSSDQCASPFFPTLSNISSRYYDIPWCRVTISPQGRLRRVFRLKNVNNHFEHHQSQSIHTSLYLSMPNWSTWSLPLIPSFLSISYSTGRPWQSQPKRRVTWCPVEQANLVTTSLIVPARMWP